MTDSRGTRVSRVAAEWATERPGPIQAGASALILGDPAALLARALEAAGARVTRWHRMASPDQLHTPWPPSGVFDEAWVRLPRSGPEASMLLHAAAHRVAPGGRILLFGAKDEGIRSAAKHFPEDAGTPETRLVKRRCRVLESALVTPLPDLDGLERWASVASIDWGTGPRSWTFFPGVFSSGRLDAATALLIACLPPTAGKPRVLDFGAGTGVLGAAVLEGTPDAEVHLLDADVIALEAARRNVPTATVLPGADLSASSGPYDLIVSNPPYHSANEQDLTVAHGLVEGAGAHLAPGGRLVLVGQRRLPFPTVLHRSFRTLDVLGDRGPFRVWSALHPLVYP